MGMARTHEVRSENTSLLRLRREGAEEDVLEGKSPTGHEETIYFHSTYQY